MQQPHFTSGESRHTASSATGADHRVHRPESSVTITAACGRIANASPAVVFPARLTTFPPDSRAMNAPFSFTRPVPSIRTRIGSRVLQSL